MFVFVAARDAVSRAKAAIQLTIAGPQPPTPMIAINDRLQPADLLPALQRMWELSAAKLVSLQETWKPEQGTPVFTVGGRYTSQGWTEWTQGFQFGSAILQFDATGDERFWSWDVRTRSAGWLRT